VPVRLNEIIVDARDPRALAAFWCDVLGYRVLTADADDPVVEIGAAPQDRADLERGPVAPTLVFVPVREPKREKVRIHLDVTPVGGSTRDGEVSRLLRLGATRADVGQGAEVSWVVLADPEGNEFCVLSGEQHGD
jgi:hypothetical protein